MIDQYTVIDLDKENEYRSDIDKYSCKRVQSNPLSNRDQNLDHLCFVELFPYGFGGIYDDRPHGSINPSMFVRHLLQHSCPIARRNIQYLFSAVHNKDVRAADSGIYASLHSSKIPNLNAGTIKQKINDNNIELETKLSNTLAAVRGSKEYWNLIYSDLLAFDEAFGPATWFATFSFAEYNDELLHEYLIKMNSDLPNIKDLSFKQLIKLDPVSVSNYFEKKLRSFFNTIIKNEKGPLGHITHFFWRREYQARGIPHCHSKLWGKGAPVYGRDPDEEVLKYITTHITCAIPNKDEDPELYDLVMKYQVHKCTSSCQKLRFNKKTKKKTLICRYGFPRPVQKYASLNTVKQTLQTQFGSSGKRKRLYNLARTWEERYINDYNPYLLKLWKNNMDMQFVATNENALNHYISGYMSKPEKSNTEAIWNECNKNKSLQGALKSYALNSFKKRELGIYEVADKLNGRSLCEFSDQIQYLNAIEKSQRTRRLKDYKEILKLSDNDNKIFHLNLIDDYYPNRPHELFAMCLFDFLSKYDYMSKACAHIGKDSSLCFALQNDLGFICRRNKIKVVKIPKIKPVDVISTEKYFHQMLICFKPWTDESILKSNFYSYQEAFQYSIENKSVSSLFTEFQAQQEKIEIAAEICRKMYEEVSKPSDNKSESEIECDDSIDYTGSQQQLLNLGVTDLPTNYISPEVVERYVGELNHQQREIYDDVINHIDHQELHKANKCNCNKPPIGMKRFISGYGGRFYFNIYSLFL